MRHRVQWAKPQQSGITVVARVSRDDGKKASLERLLRKIDDEWNRKVGPETAILPLQQVRTIHFARFALLRNEDDYELLFSTCFDRSKKQQLRDLGDLVTAGLHEVLLHCEDYFNYGGSISIRIARFLEDHDVGVGTAYVAAPGLSVTTILEQHALHQQLRNELDMPGARAGTPKAVAARLKRRLAPLDARAPLPSSISVALYYAGALTKGVAWGAVAGASALPFGPVLLQKEWWDAKELERAAIAQSPKELAESRREEDIWTARLERDESRWAPKSPQSALTHLVDIKSGPVRWLALHLSLGYVALRAQYWDNLGQLAGIDSIHFARWVPLPGGRLLFLSDYDGNWEGYLGEFVDDGPLGLSAVWSNTLGFPKTRFLIADGARDERTFKHWVRRNQVETSARYSAYPDLTVADILQNDELAEGFARAFGFDDGEAAEWLGLI